MIRVTFTPEVREELYHFPVEKRFSYAELAGLIKFKGSIEIGETTYIELLLKDTGAVRRAKLILKAIGIDDTSVIYQNQEKLNPGKTFIMKVRTYDVKKFISEIGLDLIGRIRDDFFRDPAIISAFLRGAFISSGYIADPSKYHHLEFYSRQIDVLKWLKEKLENNFGMVGFIVDVRYGYRFYIKDGEMINEFLNLIGAINSAKFFSSIMSSKKINSDVTRSMNFIDANSKRSGNASWKQISAIKLIQDQMELENFPEDIQKIALLRLNHPELSLREIGNMLNPPLSKSVVYRRLSKIIKMAEKKM